MLKVTLVKSKIGNTPANRATVKALGLNKIGSSNTFEDSPSIRGMIHKVKHLLKVEENVEGEVIRRRRDGKAVSDKRSARVAAANVAEAPARTKIASTAKAAPKAKAESKSAAKDAGVKAKKSAKASKDATEDAKDAAGKANEDKPKRTTKKKSEEA